MGYLSPPPVEREVGLKGFLTLAPPNFTIFQSHFSPGSSSALGHEGDYNSNRFVRTLLARSALRRASQVWVKTEDGRPVLPDPAHLARISSRNGHSVPASADAFGHDHVG